MFKYTCSIGKRKARKKAESEERDLEIIYIYTHLLRVSKANIKKYCVSLMLMFTCMDHTVDSKGVHN